jgi:hypothetical protein
MSQVEETTRSHLDRVKDAVKVFEAVQHKHRGHGAGDTEPDGVWHAILRDAACARSPRVPSSSDGWELYSQRGSAAAAGALASAALAAVKVIQAVPLGDARPVKDWLRDYCWRCQFPD